jgi:hypothetical protein
VNAYYRSVKNLSSSCAQKLKDYNIQHASLCRICMGVKRGLSYQEKVSNRESSRTNVLRIFGPEREEAVGG